MKKINIYNLQDSNADYMFRDWECAIEYGFNFKDYNLVFDFERDITDNYDLELENIFREFNRVNLYDVQRLEDIGYTSHSMSTSDIVQIDNKYFYCDSFGWKDITDYIN